MQSVQTTDENSDGRPTANGPVQIEEKLATPWAEVTSDPDSPTPTPTRSDPSNYSSALDAAKVLGVDEKTIRNWLKDKRIIAEKPGVSRLFHRKG